MANHLTSKTDLNPLIDEIKTIMVTYIPDFEKRFVIDVTQAAIDEVRAEKSFEIRTARALVFGETGVGKTTTINYLLNNPVFPTSGELSCTKSLACGEHAGGLIVYDSPGLGDEAGLENVTRTVLGIEQLPDEPIDQITLLDITTNNTEGPSTYIELTYSAFAEEISAEFYEHHQTNIKAKQFNVTDFATWSADHFDFFVFVTSSMRGLPTPIAKVLQTFDKVHQGQTILFKVFNVFNRAYQAEVEQLKPAIKKKFEQGIERSHKYDLTKAEQWFIIDSQTGDGVESLIQAFAETLPLEILRNLNQVVKLEYSHLIQQKIVDYFFDYVTHVACLLAVFRVDYATQGERFLQFAIDSILTMANFMFSGQGQIVSAEMLDDITGELEFSKRRLVYKDEVTKRKKENFLLNMVDKLGKRIKPSFSAYDQLGAYELEPQRVPQAEYFTIGGVEAIQITLALGLMVNTLHQDNDEADDSNWELHRRAVEANINYSVRRQLAHLISQARETEDSTEKLRLAQALYTHVRPLMMVE